MMGAYSRPSNKCDKPGSRTIRLVPYACRRQGEPGSASRPPESITVTVSPKLRRGDPRLRHTGTPVYITHDTFSGNTCSHGAAPSGLYANFDVTNSLLTANKAIGWGGTLRIEYSTLDDNPSGVFQNTPGIFDSVDATTPRRSWSTRRSAEPGELLWPHAGRRRSAAMSL